MDSAERGGNAAVAGEVSNEEERRATERKVDARRKGRWPRVERVLLAADRERRTLQAADGGCEFGGIAERVLLATRGVVVAKKKRWQLVMRQLWLGRR